MKTAYELAMERLGKTSPAAKLSDEQKRALADLDSVYRARLAEREIASKSALAAAEEKGDLEAAELVQQQLVGERRKLQAELEEKKERIRRGEQC
jgi:hypothetical protein